VLQISIVWKSQDLSLIFWILDSCNVLVSDKNYITQKPDIFMSTSPLLQLQDEENLKMSFNKINKLKKKLWRCLTFVVLEN
jgi:hypothetical protein